MEPPSTQVQLTKSSIDAFDRQKRQTKSRQDPPEDPPSILQVKPDRRSSNETSITSLEVLSQSSISSVDYSFESSKQSNKREIKKYRPEFKSATFMRPPSNQERPPTVPRQSQQVGHKKPGSLLRVPKVNFSSVEVREHAYEEPSPVPRRLGLTPSKELQWQAHTVNYFDVEDYEAARAPRRNKFKNVANEGKALLHHEKEDPPNRISHVLPARPKRESRNDSDDLAASYPARFGGSEIGTLGSRSLIGTSQSLIGDSYSPRKLDYERESKSEIQVDDSFYDVSVLSLQEGETSQSMLYGDYHKNGLSSKKKRRGLRGLFRRRKPKNTKALDDI